MAFPVSSASSSSSYKNSAMELDHSPYNTSQHRPSSVTITSTRNVSSASSASSLQHLPLPRSQNQDWTSTHLYDNKVGQSWTLFDRIVQHMHQGQCYHTHRPLSFLRKRVSFMSAHDLIKQASLAQLDINMCKVWQNTNKEKLTNLEPKVMQVYAEIMAEDEYIMRLCTDEILNRTKPPFKIQPSFHEFTPSLQEKPFPYSKSIEDLDKDIKEGVKNSTFACGHTHISLDELIGRIQQEEEIPTEELIRISAQAFHDEWAMAFLVPLKMRESWALEHALHFVQHAKEDAMIDKICSQLLAIPKNS